jgi:hypothetical protein
LAAWRATIATVAATLGGCGDNSTAPGPLDAPAGVPDLQFVAEAITGTVAIDVAEFAADDCAVVEGCVGASGRRNLLRFATVTANLGCGDLIAGMPPPPGESNDVFQWSPCHKHHHFLNYASFELIDGAGHVVTARKQSFCLEDSQPVLLGAQSHGYSCKDQGISRGYADVYGSDLACQWIDITGMAPGAYTLRMVVNPLHTIVESDITNDVFTVGVSL